MNTGIAVIDIGQKFSQFTEHWHPRIVAELNDSYVKLGKLQGEFVWHQHENEDELFWVVKGTLTIKLRDRDLTLGPGQMVVIPHGVEHMPAASEEVHLVMLEPKTTVNTGDVQSERTLDAEWL